MVGEIGGNDYNYGFLQGTRSIQAMKAYVPQVINAIMDVAKVREYNNQLSCYLGIRTHYLILCELILFRMKVLGPCLVSK